MKVSDRGLFEIASHEGIVVNPYLDSVNVMTFGIGHTASAGQPDPAKMKVVGSEDYDSRIKLAFDVFAKDIQKFERRVNDAVKVPVNQTEFDALVSFDLNTGGIYKAMLTKHLNAGNRKAAAGSSNSGFMGWKRPASIISRRKKEQKLFATGQYSNITVPVYTVNSKRQPVRIKQLTYGEFVKMWYPAIDEPTPVPPSHRQPTPPVIERKPDEAQGVNFITSILEWFVSLFKS